MAKKVVKEKSMEETLWKSCDKLRGAVEPSQYKHVVLSLIFLKYASDRFYQQVEKIRHEYGDQFVDTLAFFTKDNVFFLSPECRWDYIMQNAKQNEVFKIVDDALTQIEKDNPSLKVRCPPTTIPT